MPIISQPIVITMNAAYPTNVQQSGADDREICFVCAQWCCEESLTETEKALFAVNTDAVKIVLNQRNELVDDSSPEWRKATDLSERIEYSAHNVCLSPEALAAATRINEAYHW